MTLLKKIFKLSNKDIDSVNIENNNPEAEEKIFSVNPGDKVEEIYFYRILFGNSFLCTFSKEKDVEAPLFLQTNPFSQEKFVVCDEKFLPVKSFDENSVLLTNGKKLQGYVVEYVGSFNSYISDYDEWNHYYLNKNEPINWSRSFFKNSISALGYKEDKLKKILNKYNDKKILKIQEDFLYDKNGEEKDFFYVKAVFNWTQLSFKIESKNIIREICYSSNLLPRVNSICAEYNFNLGKCSQNYIDEKSNPNFPKGPFNLIMKKVKIMRNIWAKTNITSDCKSKGYEKIWSFVQCPYEPGIAKIIRNFNKNDLFINRNSPEVFSDLCKKLKIRNFRGLRRSFLENPISLVKCWILNRGGFSNVDILKKMIDCKELDFIIDNQESSVYFFQRALSLKSEKSVCNMFIKKSNYYIVDCFEMFFLCKHLIENDFVKKIIEEGFSQYNHDVLSKLSIEVNNADNPIAYSNLEKNYICKLAGYKFKLPKGTGELRKLGWIFHNCVASYATRALTKNCTIAYVTKDKEFKICIEIVKDEVVQALGKYNSKLAEKEENILNVWMKRCGLKLEEKI